MANFLTAQRKKSIEIKNTFYFISFQEVQKRWWDEVTSERLPVETLSNSIRLARTESVAQSDYL